MNSLSNTLEIDLHLMKRAAAREFRRKRRALRLLVKAGVFTPAQARVMPCGLVNILNNWIAARNLLNGSK